MIPLRNGGTFSSVSTAPGVSPGGTFTRNNLVAFNPSTGVIAAFAPNVAGEVWALATDGTSLYVGGTFASVNGVARRGLAKLNPVTGAVDTAFNAGFASGRVTDAAVVDGRLLVAGTFPGKLRALNLASGANTGYINVAIGGTVAGNAGPTEVYGSPSTRPGRGWSGSATSPPSAARPAGGRSCSPWAPPPR